MYLYSENRKISYSGCVIYPDGTYKFNLLDPITLSVKSTDLIDTSDGFRLVSSFKLRDNVQALFDQFGIDE